MATDTPIRVAQWGTGNVGSRALRRIIEHPGMELVGLWVHSQSKVGRDAGEFAETAPTGILATHDIADIIAARPDCVVYMQQGTVLDDVCRLLESGINIVTTRDDFHDPTLMDPAVRARIEAACAQGGSSIHSSGSSPGFITEAVPIVLASLTRRIDCITIDEYADCSSRDSREMLFEIMAFGKDPATISTEGMAHHLKTAFSGTIRATAKALGLDTDEATATVEFATACGDVAIAAGTVPDGTMAAQRIVVAAKKDGRTVIQWRAHWYVSRDIAGGDGWNLRESGWRVLVEGDTPLDVAITFPVAEADYPAFTPNLTAHRPINVIPYLVAAPPGIRTTADLPQIIADLRR